MLPLTIENLESYSGQKTYNTCAEKCNYKDRNYRKVNIEVQHIVFLNCDI